MTTIVQGFDELSDEDLRKGFMICIEDWIDGDDDAFQLLRDGLT